VRHQQQGLYPYHVPSHKAGRGLDVDFAGNLVQCDLTELPGLDNLAAPTGPLAAAEALAASLADACATYFTTNGSTAGLIAGVLATAPPGSTILLPQTAHLSLYSACVLGDLRPVFLPVELHPELPLALGYTTDTLRAALAKHHPSLVVATSPTYHGAISDISAFTSLCREYAVPLLVDEAHGTHLLVSDRPAASAARSKADVVVQSVHKTGGALTGAAWVHCFNPALTLALKRALRLMQSTSPSYLLLASLDLARRALATAGLERFRLACQQADKLRELLPTVFFPSPWQQDPLRVVIDARYFGLSGFALHQAMLDCGLSPEMADTYTVTLVVGLSESDEGVERVLALAKGLPRVTTLAEIVGRPYYLSTRAQVLTPREAYFAVHKWVPLMRGQGEICAEPLVPYPPGVPLVGPGQTIEREDVAYIQELIAAGGSCTGVSATGQILVIAGEYK